MHFPTSEGVHHVDRYRFRRCVGNLLFVVTTNTYVVKCMVILKSRGPRYVLAHAWMDACSGTLSYSCQDGKNSMTLVKWSREGFIAFVHEIWRSCA